MKEKLKRAITKVKAWVGEHVEQILMGFLFVLGAIAGWIMGRDVGKVEGVNIGAEAQDAEWWFRGVNAAGEVPQKFEVIHDPATSSLKDLFKRETNWADERIDEYCGERRIVGLGVYTTGNDE